jgi:hypothetical protein
VIWVLTQRLVAGGIGWWPAAVPADEQAEEVGRKRLAVARPIVRAVAVRVLDVPDDSLVSDLCCA